MISVIIPLYNKVSYIEETIASVLAQTFDEFELLVVNDGSTDNSLSIVEKINDTRVQIISIENAGVSVARNTGIKAAIFPWIALLDGDDWWAPTFLEDMVNAIEKYPDEVLFASGRSRVFGSDIERYSHPLLPKDGETELLSYFKIIAEHLPLINSSNVVIKRSHFDDAGYFRAGQKQHEDHDLWMRLSINNEVVFINKNLSFYRKVLSGSASSLPYNALDFYDFLNTIIEVRNETSHTNKSFINTYANRYALLTYIKNYGSYTTDEKNILSKPLNELTSGKYKFIYNLSKLLPINLYPILKKIQ